MTESARGQFIGERRAVVIVRYGLTDPAAAVPTPAPEIYETGPWQLEEWDGEQWATVGHATRQRTRNRFLSGHKAWRSGNAE